MQGSRTKWLKVATSELSASKSFLFILTDFGRFCCDHPQPQPLLVHSPPTSTVVRSQTPPLSHIFVYNFHSMARDRLAAMRVSAILLVVQSLY